MRGKKAFTLIELLVVIAIIALLVGILMPALGRARELSRRAVCGSNLKAIGNATHLYANLVEGFLPTFADGGSDGVDKVGDQSGVQGATNTRCNSRGWFILVVKQFIQVKAFRCPSDEQADKSIYSTVNLYDFKPRSGFAPISYGLQVTKTWTGGGTPAAFDRSSLELVIVADRNGLNKWITPLGNNFAQVARDVDVSASESDQAAMNSPNHFREGQNILRHDTSNAWRNTPLCGPDQDNIWTRADGTKLGLTGAADVCAGAPRDGKDSFLSP